MVLGVWCLCVCGLYEDIGSFSFDAKMEYNSRNPAVRRLMKEAKELQDDPSEDFAAAPMEDNLFEWHFTVRGPPETPFEGGEYHGRIILPPEYPMKPPSIIFLTVSERRRQQQQQPKEGAKNDVDFQLTLRRTGPNGFHEESHLGIRSGFPS